MNDTGNLTTAARPFVDFVMLNSLAEAQGEGEPDLIVELIDLYLGDTPKRVANMREAVANSDRLGLARGAHALKGSSATLGAVQVAESCTELEILAGELSFTKAALVLNRLDNELASLEDAFMIERQERSEQTK